jgi:DNA-binding HxlR family transcriptional regulator
VKLEKVTKRQIVGERRSYEDACAAAHALDLVGERWALLVMRELMVGPRRFGDLRSSLPGISANVLTQRLEGLEAAGVLLRRKLPPPAAVQVYELTPWGYESEPIFQALGRWAARSPAHDPTLPFSAASLLLSLRTMLDPGRAEGIDARIGFRLGAEAFLGHLAGGRIEIARGTLDGADLVFTGTAPVIAGAIYGGQPLEALEAAGSCASKGTGFWPTASSPSSLCLPRWPCPSEAARHDRRPRTHSAPVAAFWRQPALHRRHSAFICDDVIDGVGLLDGASSGGFGVSDSGCNQNLARALGALVIRHALAREHSGGVSSSVASLENVKTFVLG